MRIPMSWLRELLPGLRADARDVADALIRAGLEVEKIDAPGAEITGVVVAEVLDIEELTGFKKPIRFVEVSTGAEVRRVVCGAANFATGDRVAYAPPGAVLAGGFEIGRRKTYGRDSDGMICSDRELGLGEDHTGILVLASGVAVGTDVRDLLADEVLDVAVSPDRGYCLSMRGMAREVATAFGLAFSDPAALPLPPSPAPAGEVRVEDPAGCDRYVLRRITGLDVGTTTPLEIQRRLTMAGMRPISLAVDVTNYVMLGLGQPLHAFDAAKLRGTVSARRAHPGERLLTLDGTDRQLHNEDLVIADESGPVAIAGVMGGASTEIGPKTTDILLESAHFDPISVARTARRHGLASEASRRFERHVDPELAPHAAEAAARLMATLAGAGDPHELTDVDLRRPPATIRMPATTPGRIAGRAYPAEVVRRRLADVGCSVTGGDELLAVTPPSWRPDLTGEAELVEEVLRLEGYDSIPVALPLTPAGRGLSTSQRLRRQASRALAAGGYDEVAVPPFVSGDVGDRLGLDAGDPRRAAVRLANPLSEDEAYLRTTLLPGLLAAVVRNAGRGRADLSLFETGLVFRWPIGGPAGSPPRPPVPSVLHRPSDEEIRALDAELPRQPRHVAVVLCGLRQPAGWWGAGRAADWADAVEAARTVASSVRSPLDVASGAAAPFHPGRCAELRVPRPDGGAGTGTAAGAGAGGYTVVGHAGELHPRVTAAFEVPARTCAMELDVDALVAAADDRVQAPLISPYPPADRDVALVVDPSVAVAEVARALRAGALGAGGVGLLESLRLFDVYPMPDGRRSLAFRLVFRAADRTLTAEEANDARDAAVAEAAARTGAVLRGAG